MKLETSHGKKYHKLADEKDWKMDYAVFAFLP